MGSVIWIAHTFGPGFSPLATHPVDLYLIFEKSSSTNWIFSLQKKLIFAGYTGSKNQVRNRLKIQFVELDFFKLIFQKSSTDQQGEWHLLYSLRKPHYVRQTVGVRQFLPPSVPAPHPNS
jgi:hypothetical protein